MITAFLFPYPLFLLAALYVGWRQRWRWSGRFLFVLAVLTTFFSTGIVTGQMLGWLENRYHKPDPEKTAAVAIVLSGMVNPLAITPEGIEFMGSVDRVLVGEELLRSGRVSHLLLSGGSGLMLQGESEAEKLRDWLLNRGVPPEKIWLEKDSRNTAENARESVRLLRERGVESAFLVTSAFHMLRSDLCFHKAGFDVIPFPVDYYSLKEYPFPEAYAPSPQSLAVSSIFLKEIVGLLAYRWADYL